jgi:hypothetical protein
MTCQVILGAMNLMDCLLYFINKPSSTLVGRAWQLSQKHLLKKAHVIRESNVLDLNLNYIQMIYKYLTFQNPYLTCTSTIDPYTTQTRTLK